MTGLREHFAETAAAAKHYDVTEVVLRRTRRRRQLTQAVAAAAVMVVAVSGTAVLTRGAAPAPAPAVEVVDATRPAVAGRLDWLPDRIAAGVTALPADRAVGQGALLYNSLAASRLLTLDGVRYAIPGWALGLSPDGRWLVYSANGALVFRSLTSTRAFTMADSDLTGWSVDGAVAVLTTPQSEDPAPSVATILDPDTGRTQIVPIPDAAWWQPRGLSADGDLLLTSRQVSPVVTEPPAPGLTSTAATPPPSEGVTQAAATPPAPAATLIGPPHDAGFGVAFVDPVDGTSRSVDVLAGRLGFDEQDHWGHGLNRKFVVRPDTGGLVFQLARAVSYEGTQTYVWGDLVELDPASGSGLRRYRLPTAAPDEATISFVQVVPEGILLAVLDDGFSVDRLEVLDPTTGDRRTVLSLPDDVQVVFARGGTAY